MFVYDIIIKQTNGYFILKKFILKSVLSIIIVAMTVCFSIAATTEEVKQNIIKQAKEIGVDPAIALSLAKTESGFNQNARGGGGRHIGVFQISAATAKHLGVDPYDLNGNIKGGILYYKKMYDKFGSAELALAAYNSGPIAVQRCNNTIPAGSKYFVNKIMKDYNIYKSANL